MVPQTLNNQKRYAKTVAIELGYLKVDKNVLTKIQHAKTEREVDRILASCRKKM